MENYIKKGHLTLIPGGGQGAEPIEDIPFSRLRNSLSRGQLAWILFAKLLLLASVLYVMRGFNE